ncbi:MAG: MATE family efflux transporter [Clostridia bacterium]|nr:MATE family efflux transporter [Lachnospiraceae bacterium]NCB99287.1 MATE family efflux transporter [Clostridia bacterium]NCD01436.1 MATE family efflux transporter [Clostridia bacterium]
MRIQLSDHFTYSRLLRFTLPSIAMMIFTSIYSIVDGFFVSNYVGKTAFAAINMVSPAFAILGAFGLMIGAGGTAIVGRTLGEKKPDEANAYFSMLIYIVLGIGVFVGIAGFILIPFLSRLLGADDAMLSNCILYGRTILFGTPFFMLQFAIQSFFITAEKPKLGLFITIFSGVSNILLDALFIIGFKWGLFGAAFATAFSQAAGTIIALIYFSRKNDSLLRLTLKTRFYGRVLLKACTNGSSEMVANIAASVVTILYNYQLMRFLGADGVAAYGVLMYASFVFSAIYYGYAMGCAPIVSYQYGAGNRKELKNIFKKSLSLVGIAGISMLIISKLLSVPLAGTFVGYDKELYELTLHAFQIYSFSFLLIGYNVFGSAFFTALNDGLVSAAISFLRTFVFEIGSILILPALFGIDGIWFAVIIAELAAALITSFFFYFKRNRYHYI